MVKSVKKNSGKKGKKSGTKKIIKEVMIVSLKLEDFLAI